MLTQGRVRRLPRRPEGVHRTRSVLVASSTASCQALEPPFVFVGDPDFPAAWTRRDAVQVDGGSSRATRSPGCPGAPVSPRAAPASILDSHDPTALEPGDVLVAPITDPSWTPLFVPAVCGRGRRRCPAEPRHHREPRARHPVRRLRHRGDEGDPRRCAGAGRRLDRNGHGPLMSERATERWSADTLPSEKYSIYTRANAGEVMPDPVSPLSSTMGLVSAGDLGWPRRIREGRVVLLRRVRSGSARHRRRLRWLPVPQHVDDAHLRVAHAGSLARDRRLPVLRRHAGHHAVRRRGASRRRERARDAASAEATSTSCSLETTFPSCGPIVIRSTV